MHLHFMINEQISSIVKAIVNDMFYLNFSILKKVSIGAEINIDE